MKEPMTVITDYILALECFVLAVLMLKNDPMQHSVRFWAAGFVTTAIAATAAGTHHGWAHKLDELVRVTLWKATLYTIGFSTALMLASTAFARMNGAARIVFGLLLVAQFVFYAAWMARHDDFRYVIYNYLPAMLMILLVNVYAGFHAGDRSAWWIVAGIAIVLVAAAVQRSGVRLHRHLTANDLYHLLQIVAMYLLYRGGLLLQDLR